jgi:hypothetical protein
MHFIYFYEIQQKKSLAITLNATEKGLGRRKQWGNLSNEQYKLIQNIMNFNLYNEYILIKNLRGCGPNNVYICE